MPRYHFHVDLGDRLVPDREGVDLPNLRIARGADARVADDRWEDVLRFIQDLPQRTTIITDETGRIVFVVAL